MQRPTENILVFEQMSIESIPQVPAERRTFALSAKLNEAKSYSSLGEWERYVRMFRPEHRPNALLGVRNEIPVAEFLRLAGEIWNSPEIDFLPCDFLYQCFRGLDTNTIGSLLMTDKERRSFRLLPESICIFRGHSSENLRNLSWTLDLEQAVLARDVFGYEHISKTVIETASCIALFGRRCWREIIVLPELIGDTSYVDQNDLGRVI